MQMFAVYLVRHQYQSYFGVLLLIAVQQLLVLRPCTACHNDLLLPANELLHLRYLLGVASNTCHAVETGVARQTCLRDAIAFQQFYRRLVLHKQMRELLQQLALPRGIPMEEILLRTEDGGNGVKRHMLLTQLADIGRPELVFHKHRHARLHGLHKLAGVAARGKRQISHQIHLVVLLSHLIA